MTKNDFSAPESGGDSQMQNLSERKEVARRQAQKMEAIGQLSGGIAHDFNNLLAVIILHVDMLDLQLAPDSPVRFRVNEIKTAAARAASLTRQLLAFSRRQMLQPRRTNLNQVTAEVAAMLHRLLGENIELKLELAEDLGVCLVDPDQMTQVLMNLAVNARDAMPDGGEITIKTKNVALDDATRRKDASQAAGDYIEFAVADTGQGMDAATQEHIFEPFFTTKPAGKGTGLGLSTVYGIVKQSNGFIWVTSAPNGGATFRVQFPRVADANETSAEIAAQSNDLSGSETILLVEDEAPVRRAALEVLQMLGYKVLEAKDGEDALALARKSEKPIDLLLTDVVMPRMNGTELAGQIKSLHAEIAVLFVSGYTDDRIAQHGVLNEDILFLEKPFSPQQLAQKVREALQSSKSETRTK